jgi:hypothetical protein
MEREMAQQHDHLHSATLRILDSVRTHGRNPLRPRREGVYQRSGRYGNCKAGRGGTSHFDCKDCNIGPNHVDCCPPSCAPSSSLLKQLPALSPSLFGFSQAWIWKCSLDSASRNSSKKDCYTGPYRLP